VEGVTREDCVIVSHVAGGTIFAVEEKEVGPIALVTFIACSKYALLGGNTMSKELVSIVSTPVT